eukprot:scaffold25017_cov142-Cylindrotheca_fusiformis.AAC.2
MDNSHSTRSTNQEEGRLAMISPQSPNGIMEFNGGRFVDFLSPPEEDNNDALQSPHASGSSNLPAAQPALPRFRLQRRQARTSSSSSSPSSPAVNMNASTTAIPREILFPLKL